MQDKQWLIICVEQLESNHLSEKPMPTIHYTNVSNEPVTAEVISISGEVIEINRSNQTHLHASGGSAHASASTHYGGHTRVTAHTSPVSITSSTSVHDDVYLLTETGEEVFLQLVNWENAGIRKGHQIQVIWLDNLVNNQTKLPTPYAIVNNRSLNKVLYDNDSLSEGIKATSTLKANIAAFKHSSIGLKIGLIACLIIFFPIGIVPFKVMLDNQRGTRLKMLEQDVKPQLTKFLLPPLSKAK